MGRRAVVLLVAVILAAVGTGLVFVYVNGADNRAEEGKTLVSVIVAKSPIPSGTPLNAITSLLDTQKKKVPADLLEGVTPLTELDISEKPDLIAQGDILPGEIVRLDRFAAGAVKNDAPAEIPALGLAIQLGDPQRVSPYLKPGSPVMVFTTSKGTPAKTTKLLDRVNVLKVGAVGGSATTAGTATDVPQQIVTLDVDEAQAEKVLDAQANGTLWLAAIGGKAAATP